jgi:hypothetical protein
VIPSFRNLSITDTIFTTTHLAPPNSTTQPTPTMTDQPTAVNTTAAAHANHQQPTMQPYAPYPGPYGQAIPHPYADPQGHAGRPPVDRNWEISKLALHACSLVFGIITLALSLSVPRDTWASELFLAGSVPVVSHCPPASTHVASNTR